NNRIGLITKLNSNTSISLNLTARESKKKQYEQSELDIENDYLRSTGKEPIEKFDQEVMKINDFKEILMNQTHVVMADFIDLSNQFGFTW
ncbi:MAG: tail-specific protease, partial [Deltaproteobacteria bacterium]